MLNTPITACVITLNEERSIGACIDSLRVCDEVIVVDAHSTDRTREIAAAQGARVIERDWAGSRSQKQFAVREARHDWIISIDADERLSPRLVREIGHLRQYGLGDCAGYDIPFLANEGDWHPDHQLRMFDRRRCAFRGGKIHEKVVAFGPVRKLTNHILHDSYRDHPPGKVGSYARLMSEVMHAHELDGHTAPTD